MSIRMGWYLYLLAALLLAIAFLLGRPSRRNRVRMRDMSGNMIVGDVSGTASQTTDPKPSIDQQPDRVAWGIGIVGVLIAVGQLGYSIVHDLLAK